MRMMAFFFVVLAIYISLNIYLLVRGAQAMSLTGVMKWVYVILFVVLSSSLILGMAIENRLPIGMTSALQLVGSTWFFTLMYLFMAALFFDLLRIGNYFFNYYPAFVKDNYPLAKQAVLVLTLLTVGIVLAWGNYKFNRPVVEHLTLQVDKSVSLEGLCIVMVSDVHLGYTIDKKRLQGFVSMINAQKPDIVLFAGDLIDRSLRPVLDARMGEELLQIEAPLGVYAILGNHEYYGDLSRDCEFFKQSGITLLRDSVAMPGGRCYVVGRDDRTNRRRKSLAELTAGLDHRFPIILLDHQPYHLEEAETAKVDFQFSGHVHNGQVWPIKLIARSMYELAYGYKQKGNTHVYVSSGLGIWGPHLRIGTQSELLDLTIRGREK